MEALRQEEVLFFQGKAGALPLYLALREKLPELGEVEIQVKKTQISLIRRYIFGAVLAWLREAAAFAAARAEKNLRPMR